MPKRYFDLADDVYLPGRWELGSLTDDEGREVSPWLLMRGEPVSLETRLRVPITRSGRALDFSLAAFGVPVVHTRVASLFEELAPEDVQLLPVTVGGQPDQYVVLNAIRLIRCVDERRSKEVHHWGAEDGIPEKIGQYFSVLGLRIDSAEVGHVKVFRPLGWSVVMIVSEEIKEAMERVSATGPEFKEV